MNPTECVRCHKKATLPFLCASHNKELEALKKRFPEFDYMIDDLYTKNKPISEILDEVHSKALWTLVEIEKAKEEMGM